MRAFGVTHTSKAYRMIFPLILVFFMVIGSVISTASIAQMAEAADSAGAISEPAPDSLPGGAEVGDPDMSAGEETGSGEPVIDTGAAFSSALPPVGGPDAPSSSDLTPAPGLRPDVINKIDVQTVDG